MVEILATLVLISILVATAVPRFVNISVLAKKKATAAGIAEFNGREKQLWHKALLMNDSAVWADDETLDRSLYDSMDFDLNSGTENDWVYSGASWAADGVDATLTFKDVDSEIWRYPATLDTPGRWMFGTVLFSGFTSSTDWYEVWGGAQDDGWTIADGTLSSNGENGFALIDGTDAEDYIITLDATLSSGNGYGILYNTTKTENRFPDGYCFQFDPGLSNQFVVRLFSSEGESIIDSVSMTDVFGADFDLTAEHAVTVEVSGSAHTISVDGIEVLSFTDDTYSGGSVGVRTWGGSDVVIENLEVVGK